MRQLPTFLLSAVVLPLRLVRGVWQTVLVIVAVLLVAFAIFMGHILVGMLPNLLVESGYYAVGMVLAFAVLVALPIAIATRIVRRLRRWRRHLASVAARDVAVR